MTLELLNSLQLGLLHAKWSNPEDLGVYCSHLFVVVQFFSLFLHLKAKWNGHKTTTLSPGRGFRKSASPLKHSQVCAQNQGWKCWELSLNTSFLGFERDEVSKFSLPWDFHGEVDRLFSWISISGFGWKQMLMIAKAILCKKTHHYQWCCNDEPMKINKMCRF